MILPASFVPTHTTAGLDGYPALDVFGVPGERVTAGFWGIVRRVSGRPASAGGTPGGAYGRSLYIRNRVSGVERYCTHFDELTVSVGSLVWPGRALGTIADSAVSGKPGTSHIHMGSTKPRP